MQPHENNSTVIRLPAELLTEIFRVATDNPVRDTNSLISWTPFEISYASSKHEVCSASLRTKHALSLVCRLFRKLMAEFLYEDIWIRHGHGGLRHALESSRGEDANDAEEGYGMFTQRVTISYLMLWRVGSDWNSLHADTRAILSCCPYVRIICRPPQKTLEGMEFADVIPDIDDLDFPFLERVEWHNTPNDSISATASTPSTFLFSDTIRVLILGSDSFPFRRNESDLFVEVNEHPQTIISLPKFHILSIQSIEAFGELPRRYDVHLPSLRHLILKRPQAIYNLFDGALRPFGAQLTSLELAPDFRFLRQDFLSTLLKYCPNVSDVYVPVFATRAVHQNAIPRVLLEFTSVKRVHLHAGLPNGYVYGQQAWWSMLDAHFDGLCGTHSRFVALERIALAGPEWLESVRGERFAYALQLVVEKGIQLVADDVDVRRSLNAAIGRLDRDQGSPTTLRVDTSTT